MWKGSGSTKSQEDVFSIAHVLLEFSADLDRVFVYKVAKIVYGSLDTAVGGLSQQLKVRRINSISSINLILTLEHQCEHQKKIDVSRIVLKRLEKAGLRVKNFSIEMKAPGDAGRLGSRVSMCIPTIDFQRWSKVS